MNTLTKGKAKIAELIPASGKYIHTQTGSVARTDTSAKTLFTLPANAIITALRVYTATASDAGTSATLSVGKLGGTGVEFLNAQDIKGGGVGVLGTGAKTVLGTVGTSAVTVTGTYAETGGASTTGGPWLVYIDYTV
jgi:hypothetical protein